MVRSQLRLKETWANDIDFGSSVDVHLKGQHYQKMVISNESKIERDLHAHCMEKGVPYEMCDPYESAYERRERRTRLRRSFVFDNGENERVKKIEEDLETLCKEKGVRYEPFELNETDRETKTDKI